MIRNSVTQTYQQKAFLFQPSNPVPVSIHVVPEDKVVSTAAFVPSKNGKYSSIVYLSEENELKMLHIDEESAIANKVETVVVSLVFFFFCTCIFFYFFYSLLPIY